MEKISIRGLQLAALLVAGVLVASTATAAPAAPAVSIHADIKQLQFSWNNVPGATRYELWFLPLQGAAWVKYAELPATRLSLAVNVSGHFIFWNDARYVLKACDATGCNSSHNLDVSHLMQQTVGVFRLPAGSPHAYLGMSVDLSEDGSTLAGAMDIDEAGGVEVFRKSGSSWAREATLLGDAKQEDIDYGPDLAVATSGNGNVIALGVNSEGRPGLEGAWNFGAVYLFRRTSLGWVREQKLQAATAISEDNFGRRVDLDESGNLLAIWRRFGEPPYPDPGVWWYQGHVQLFRYANGSWSPVANIPGVSDGCEAMALSGDGGTLVRSCGSYVDVFTAPTWQRVARLPNPVFGMAEFSTDVRKMAIAHDGRSFAVRSVTYDGSEDIARAMVNVYRLGASGWAREATLEPGPWTVPGPVEGPSADYGFGVAMSRDGRFLAVGASGDQAAGAGVVYPPIGLGQGGFGAVYVYERKPAGWVLRQFIKPNDGVTGAFGWSVAFARDGKDLAVGAYLDGGYKGSISLY